MRTTEAKKRRDSMEGEKWRKKQGKEDQGRETGEQG